MPGVGTGQPGARDPRDVWPVRLIAYAWGDKYTDELLSVTLRAVLSPKNLPAVIELAPTEVVLLIQEEHRGRVAGHPTIQRMRQLCPVRLVGLDDLIVAREKYGVTLTYVLHRGMRVFGADVTQTNFLFLNADFVVADGSLRNAVLALLRGEHVVAAPSYCAVGESARAELRQFIDLDNNMLAIKPRELARLALRQLHNTVKGKTLNQSGFHLAQIDQFYWWVDDNTLLGHQMPVAIVGMRPERAVSEPNTYWDHGLISEFCPNAKPYLLGDSDDFLMVELRDRQVASDQIVAGLLDCRKVAPRMISWVTPYQRAFAELPLTLHCEDLPSTTASERAKLAAKVAEIFGHGPKTFPSHRNHPQWDYHLGPFMEARHQHLSLQLGRITEQQAPPASLTPIDQLWWRLDGARKRRDRRHAGPGRAMFFEEPLLAAEPGAAAAAFSRSSRTVERPDTVIEIFPVESQSSHGSRDYAIEAEIAALERSYATLLRKHVTSAMIPQVNILHYPGEMPSSRRDANPPRRIREALKHRLRLAFYRSSLHRARGAVANAVAQGARDALVIVGDFRLAEELTPSVPGLCASISSHGATNLAYSLAPAHKFDLCIWELNAGELAKLPQHIEALRFCLKAGAVVIGFCCSDQLSGQPMRALESWIDAGSEVHVAKASRVALITSRVWRVLRTYGLSKTVVLVAQCMWPSRLMSRWHQILPPCERMSSGSRPPSGVTVVTRLRTEVVPRPEGEQAAFNPRPVASA